MAGLLKAMLNVIFSGWLNTILKALTAHTSVISDICDKTKGVMIPIASVFFSNNYIKCISMGN